MGGRNGAAKSMNVQPESTRPQADVLAGARFRPLAFFAWLAAAAALGAVAAWLAVGAQFYFAPLLLFPILVGTGLGAASVGLMRIAQMGNRPTVLLGVLLSAAVAVAGQHYLGYLDYRQHELARNLPLIENEATVTTAGNCPAAGGAGRFWRVPAGAGGTRPAGQQQVVAAGLGGVAELGRRRPAGGGRGPGHGHSRQPAAVLQRLPKLASYDAGGADGPGRRHATGPPG